MPYVAHNAVFASGLNVLRDQVTAMYICSGGVSEVASAIARQLARHVLTSADFTLADGDTSGRKITIAAQAAISIANSGNADHIALSNGVTMFYTTQAVSQALTAGGTVDVPAFDIEFRDPVEE